jgi:hypothetical protein
VISPLLSNVYLNEVDRMLERAKEVTRDGDSGRESMSPITLAHRRQESRVLEIGMLGSMWRGLETSLRRGY